MTVDKVKTDIIPTWKAEILRKEHTNEVLEKIKADIEARCCITVGRECDPAITLYDVFNVIDKYKAESEDKG